MVDKPEEKDKLAHFMREVALTLKEIREGVVGLKKIQEEAFAKMGMNQGKFLYVESEQVTDVETILNKHQITSNQWLKSIAPLQVESTVSIYEYMLNCSDDKFKAIIADCQELESGVAWSLKKPEVIVSL